MKGIESEQKTRPTYTDDSVDTLGSIRSQLYQISDGVISITSCFFLGEVPSPSCIE